MTDTNQASEDIRNHISRSICHEAYSSEYEELTSIAKWTHDTLVDEIIMPAINALIRTEKLKLLNELDKSMPTAEQLTTKYGYHMPEKQYGYKLALHDIREVIAKLEAEL